MKLSTRPMTQADIDKITAYHRGDIQKPQWLVDWEKKLENARRALAAAVHQQSLDPHQQDQYMQAIVKMMHRRDRLYNIWMDELPFKTWEELAAERPPSADDLFRYTVKDTEDYLNGPAVSAFVFFLGQKWNGFLKDYTHQCLRDCDPLIEEGVEMTSEVRRTVSYPEQAFNTNNREELGTRLLEWARKTIPPGSPIYVQRLLIANVMVALGNEMDALTEMEFARAEAVAPNFAKLMSTNSPEVDIYLTQAQRWQIDVLLSMWPSE